MKPKNLQQVKLIALSSGIGKTGKPWYRAVLKANAQDGSPIVESFWLAAEVGEQAKLQGLLEDVDILVECGLDQRLRPAITGIYPAHLEGGELEL